MLRSCIAKRYLPALCCMKRGAETTIIAVVDETVIRHGLLKKRNENGSEKIERISRVKKEDSWQIWTNPEMIWPETFALCGFKRHLL